MRRAAPATAILCLLLPRLAPAAEVDIDVKSEARYDSNSTGSDQGGGQQDDEILSVSPRFRIRTDPGGRYEASLSYRPNYQYFVHDRDRRGFEHFFDATAGYSFTKRTSVTGSLRFDRTIRLLSDLQGDEDIAIVVPDTDEEISRQQDFTNRWSGSVGLNHSFSPRWRGSFLLSTGETDYPEKESSDNSHWNTNASAIYIQSARSSIGAGFGVSNQTADATDTQPEFQTRSYQVYGIWNYTLSPGFTLQLQAGPAYVDPQDQDISDDVVTNQVIVPSFEDEDGVFAYDFSTCDRVDGQIVFNDSCDLFDDPVPDATALALQNVVPGALPSGVSAQQVDNRQLATIFGESIPDTQESSLTYFANVALIKDWDTVRASLRFLRSDSGNLGQGNTSIIDRLIGQVRWRPAERWTIDFQASWSQRTSASESQTQQVNAIRGSVPSSLSDPIAGTFFGGDDCFPPAVQSLTAADGFCNTYFNGQAVLAPGTVVNTGEFGFIKVDRATKTTTYGFRIGVTRQFTKRVDGLLRFNYRQQENTGAFGGGESFDEFIIGIGVRYRFDPIRL